MKPMKYYVDVSPALRAAGINVRDVVESALIEEGGKWVLKVMLRPRTEFVLVEIVHKPCE